jgi:hypothetical protein
LVNKSINGKTQFEKWVCEVSGHTCLVILVVDCVKVTSFDFNIGMANFVSKTRLPEDGSRDGGSVLESVFLIRTDASLPEYGSRDGCVRPATVNFLNFFKWL